MTGNVGILLDRWVYTEHGAKDWESKAHAADLVIRFKALLGLIEYQIPSDLTEEALLVFLNKLEEEISLEHISEIKARIPPAQLLTLDQKDLNEVIEYGTYALQVIPPQIAIEILSALQ